MAQIGWMVPILTALATGQAHANDNIYILENGTQCRPQGDNRNLAAIALVLKKNRATAPYTDDIDADVTLGAMLSPGDDTGRLLRDR
jgi:hypothetical protein